MNIIDFVSKNKKNATMLALGKHYNRFKDERRRKLKKNKVIAIITSKIFEKQPHLTLKQTLKQAKKQVRDAANSNSTQRKVMKATIKALKVYQHFFEEQRQSMSEDEWLYLLIRPLLKLVLKDFPMISMICGERTLKCAAKRVNAKLDDHQRRDSYQPVDFLVPFEPSRVAASCCAGPKIDIIFSRKSGSREVGILELSGSADKRNHTHFLEDRVKIATNLKHMLKSLLKSVPHCPLKYIQALKLYGFQIHDGYFYIYSMRTYDDYHFTFNLECQFEIPLHEDTIETNSPRFFSKLWMVKNLLSEVSQNLQHLFDASKEYSTLSSDSEPDSTPDHSPSPLKKQKNNA